MFCSNMHNLTHLVNDVQRFGPLDTFDAYPFESRLYGLKRLIRSGNMPLSQVARRICEIQSNFGSDKHKKPKFHGPVLKKKHSKTCLKTFNSFETDIYSFVDFGNFAIDTDSEVDRWIITDKCEIVAINHIVHNTSSNTIELYGNSLRTVYDFFLKPIASSLLYIFASNLELSEPQSFAADRILCKMVKIDCHDKRLPKSVFFPLIHSLLQEK